MLALLLLAASLGISDDLIEVWSGAFFIFHACSMTESQENAREKMLFLKMLFFSLFLTVQMHNRPTPFLRKLRCVNC